MVGFADATGLGSISILVVLDGGMGELYKFNTGGGFVGIPEPGTIAMFPLAALLLRRVRGR